MEIIKTKFKDTVYCDECKIELKISLNDYIKENSRSCEYGKFMVARCPLCNKGISFIKTDVIEYLKGVDK
jgi:hypothetical protein